MKKTVHVPLLCSVLILLALACTASAQGLVDAQATRGALSRFPDSQAVLFLNVQRIVKDAAPRIAPPGEIDKAVAQAQKVGIDLRGLEYAIAGIRFADPPQASGVPEFVVLLKGNFSADALLSIARLAIGTQGITPTVETYNSRTLNIVNVAEALKPKDGSTGNQKFPYTELAATALDANTLMVGVPSYVKAAIDAAGGTQGRLNASLVELALRNPDALSSLTMDIPESLTQHMRKAGVPANQEIDRIVGWLKRLSISTGMTALDFTLQAAVQTDNAEHANAISGMVRMGLMAAESAIKADIERKRDKPKEAQQAQMALNAISNFINRTEGDTVRLGLSIPQKTLADLIKKNHTPPAAAPGKGKAPATRRGRARTGRRG